MSPDSARYRKPIVRSVMSVQVLTTRKFRRAFLASLSRDLILLSIVSPFVTALPGFRSPLDFFKNLRTRNPTIHLQLVTRPPNDKRGDVLSWLEAELIADLGVELLIRSTPILHSKVYYIKYREGDSSSFVGSANFTKGGFETNDETIAFWRRGEDNKEVEIQVARLTGPGSVTFLQWKAHARGINIDMEDDQAE